MRSTRFRLHVGIEGKRGEVGGEGEKGVEGGKVAVSVVGRVGRVSAGTTAFPWGQLSTGARARLFTSPEYMLIRYYLSLSLSLSHLSLPSLVVVVVS